MAEPTRKRRATTRELAAWAVYDWASSPFFAVIITFVFAAYFTKAVAESEVAGTAAWGWTMTASALIIALVSPVLGAIADAGGRRKPWLAVFILISAAAICGLWWVAPSPSFVLLALVLVLIANVGLEIGQAFYNAMLPDLADEKTIGRWSGWGWGLGYIGGIVVLLIVLYGIVLPEPAPFGLDDSQAEDVRINGPIVAIWLLLFSLPLFLITPDRPSAKRKFGEAINLGLSNLKTTLADLRHQPNIVRFLVARLIYNDGLNTLFAFGGIYAAGTFNMSVTEVIQFGIALNVTSGIGAFALSYLDDRLGSKPTILISLVGLFIFGFVALVAQDKWVFFGVALVLGIFIGPTQSASRTLMARLSPAEIRTEMFGIYALTGKVTAFIGPFLFGTLTWIFESQRAGFAVVLVMFAIGGLLLTTVRER